MSDPAIKEQLTGIMESVHEIQKNYKDMGDGFKSHGGIQEFTEKTTKALEEVQEANVKREAEVVAINETLKLVENQLARGIKSANDDTIEQFAEYGDEFNRYLKKGIDITDDLISDVCKNVCEKNFKGATAEQLVWEVKELVAGSNPRGGYLIRPEVSSRMIKRVFETSPLRMVANVITISTDGIEIWIDDNEAGDGGWVGEVDTRGETDTPEVGEITILAHEIFAQPKVTQKFLDDAAIDVESWLQGKVVRKIGRTQNTAFILGDGSKKPKGILSYPDATVFGTYQRAAIQTRISSAVGTFTGSDIKLQQNDLKEDYQGGAVWLMRRNTFGTVITLTDDQDQFILQTRFLENRDKPELLSKPVLMMDDMPDLASDSLSVAYGDFDEGYTIVDRTGFRVIRDEITEKGRVKFYTTTRVGGDVTSYDSWNRMRSGS